MTNTQAAAQPKPVYTLDEAKQLNKQAGFFWFSPDSIRFFASRFSDTFYTVPDGMLFVSSERDEYSNGKRAYTVRHIEGSTGKVSTIFEFMCFATQSAALRSAKYLANGWVSLADHEAREAQQPA